MIGQVPITKVENVTKQATTPVEEKDAIKDPDEVKETTVKVKKEKTKKNPRGAGRKSNEQKRQEALENTEGKDLSSNVNNTIEENSGLGMVDFLMTEIGNMPDVVKDIAEPMLDDFDENTSYEHAYKLFTDVENELIKQGVNATKFHDLAEMYIYRPCEVTDETIKEKYPLLEQTQTQQEENTKVIEEEDVEEVGENSVAYTQEYIDSIPLEEFTYYEKFDYQDKKNGIPKKGIAIVKPLDDRYYAAVFSVNGKKVRSIIDSNKVEISPIEGIIVYPKGENGEADFSKPYLAMTDGELTTRDTVNLKSLFDGEGDSKRSQFATTLFLSNGNRLVKTDSEIKEEKKNNAVKNFEKIEGSNESKFKTKVAQYLDIIEEGLRINENSHADLLSKLNEFIGRINTLAEGVGFIKIKPLKTGSSRAELESYIKAIRNFIENPTGDVSTIVNDIVSRHNLSNITESEEFSDVVKNQASLSPALKKKVKAEVAELKEQEKDIVAQITEKNRKGSLSAVERIELKKLKDKKAEISKERKEKEASLEGNFNKVIDYVNEQINRVNAEFKLFGITPIKKIESTKANPIKDIKELKGVLDEALSAERKVEATTKEYDSKEEAIKQLMKEYEVDEATANDIYDLREKNGTLEVRKAIPSAIADVYANEYWYSGARKRFEQSLDVLFAGGVRVVSQEAIDKILNLNKPIAVTQKNVDILKQWIGGIDIEVVKPDHKDRALYDGAFGWYDLAIKRVVVVEGAPISVVLHEVGWHATLDWAKTNDTKMYEKMLQIASEAPADIRFDIVSKYGELSEEAFLDELGAEMFTRAAQKKLYEYITTQEARRWWQKMFDAFDNVFKKARLKLFRQPIKSKKIDFEAMGKMNSVDFLNTLADTMIKGEVLGKWSEKDKIDAVRADKGIRWNKEEDYKAIKEKNYELVKEWAKNNESTTQGDASEARLPNDNIPSVPTSSAKLQQNIEITNNLNKIISDINNGRSIGIHELLFEISKSFGVNVNSLEKSKYIKLPNGLHLRISDHYSNTMYFNYYKHNTDNYGLVIKQSNAKFRDNDNVDYWEFAYYPDLLNKERQIEIIRGLIEFVNNGNFSALPAPDKMNGSGKYKEVSDKYNQDNKKDTNIRQMRAYHGSGADFDRFNHSFMGTGEGAQAYGWGTYVTEVDGIAEMYADRYSTNDVDKFIGIKINGVEVDLDETLKDLLSNVNGKIRARYIYDNNLDYFYTYLDDISNSISSFSELSDSYFEEAKKETNVNKKNELNEEARFWLSQAEELKKQLNELNSIDAKEIEFIENKNYVSKGRNLYTVEIPDDNGSNYLDYTRKVPHKELDRIKEELLNEGPSVQHRIIDLSDNSSDYDFNYKSALDELIENGFTGNDLYAELEEILGSDRKASEFLHRIGYVGIKYPAEYQSGGRSDNAKNYVIFDANDIKIVDHVRYMASGSNIYGVQQGDELFVNITPEQKIGDCADLWLEQLRQSNPRAYELIFGKGENPNLMSDLMAIVRDKLKGLVDAEEIDLSDEVLREMTFEEFMTFADALENLNMQNVSKSITRVQESMEKFEAMLSAESPTSDKVKEALERWWTAAMDDGLPITRMLQGLNAHLIKEGLPKLDSRYDIANLRNLAQSKSKFFIEKFRDRGEFADFVEQAKALDAIIENNEALKDLADKLALDRVNSDKEALHSLVEVYMLAKDNIERRNMDLPCTSNDAWLESTGMADVEFVEIFEAEFTTKQLADFWRAKNKATNVSLDFLLDYGILTQEQYDKFKERQYYVPQRGFDNLELEEDKNIPRNTSVPNPKSVQALYKAGGRDTMATSPIAQILLITDNAIRTSLNNEYRKAMLDLVRMYPAYFIDEATGKSMVDYSSAWEEVTFDENGNKEINYVAFRDEELVKEDKEAEHNISVMEEKIKELNMEMGKEKRKKNPDTDLIKSLEEEVKKLKEGIVYANDHMHYRRVYDEKKGEEDKAHQVFVKDNGGDYVLTFDDKRIANALNNLHFDQAGAVEFIKKMNRYTSNIYTTYKPAFGFKNLARDIMQIILNGFSQYGWKFLGHASKNVLTCFPKGIVNIASYLNRGNIKFDEDFEEFLSSGAMTGYVYSMSLEDYRNNVKSILQGDYYEGGELTKKGWEKMKDTLKFITEFSELYVRYVAFRTGRDLGYSQHQSAVMAKNLGVNFDKRGSGFGKGSGYKIGKSTGNDNAVIWQLIDVVNNNMSFSRASMRGMASLYEPLFLGDKKTRKNTRWMLGGIAIFGVFEGLLYTFSSDDDEDKDRLIREKVGAWDRHSNTMWWVDDTTWYGKIGKNFGSITQNFIPFYTFGFELVRMIDNMYFNKAYKMSLDDAALNFGYHVYSEMINYALPIPPTITELTKTGIEAIATLDWKNDYKKIRQLAPIVVPTFAKPIAELGFNVDYLGNKIYYPLRKDKANSEYSNFNYSFLWEDEYGRHNKYILKDGDIKLQYNHEYNVIIANHLFDSYLPKPVVDAKEMLLDKFSEANGVVIEKPESRDAKYDSQVRKAAYRYAREVVKIMEDLTKDSKDAMNNRDVNIRYIANELKNLYGSEIVEIYIKAKEAVEFYETSDIDKYKRDYFAKNQRMVTDEEVRRHFNLSEEYLKHNQDKAVDNAKDVYMQLLEYQGNYDKLGWRVKNNVRVQ
ncbi:MAG: hypothetical protein J6V44_05190 [Methanobrevibacter sp.]|nr:hypothetical protein [Methanobrevibacter sp.]